MKSLHSILLAFLLVVPGISACNSSSSLIDEIDDLLDLALDPPSRRPINRDKFGVNNFFVNSEFGSIDAQFLQIRDELGISFVRVLLAWTTGVRPTPESSPNFSFFDDILSSIPAGVDVVVVLAHTPEWMTNEANWIDGNPRLTWVERWLRPAVTRYADQPGIIAWEIWNEPDLIFVPSDVVLDLGVAENYFELLSFGSEAVRTIDPTRLILNAATSAINQNFPTALDYNKTLRDLGATDLVDIWNVHYYSSNYERVIQSGGVADFLNGLGMPIWVTESGEQGPTNQLEYVERTFPFLEEEIPGIDRFYYFEYGSTAPLEENFGLRTTDPEFPASDLFLHLAGLE